MVQEHLSPPGQRIDPEDHSEIRAAPETRSVVYVPPPILDIQTSQDELMRMVIDAVYERGTTDRLAVERAQLRDLIAQEVDAIQRSGGIVDIPPDIP
jgi:hypothetical protein